MTLMVCSALPLEQQLSHKNDDKFQYQRIDIMLEVTNLKGICGFCNTTCKNRAEHVPLGNLYLIR